MRGCHILQVLLQRFAQAHGDFADALLVHGRPAKKARHWHEARPGCEDLRERRRRETTLEGSMSGGFLFKLLRPDVFGADPEQKAA